MKACILTIGDEILLGQVVNSNAAWISQRLFTAGIEVVSQLVAGDTEKSIHQALKQAQAEVDLILLTGGLGPTEDDLTVAAFATFFNKKLVRDEEWIERMRAYFESRGRVMNALNEKQADRPEGAERIDNDRGTAPGVWFENEGKTYVIMPGVPYEMQAMMEISVLPKLAHAPTARKYYQKNLFACGAGESVMAAKLVEKLSGKTPGHALDAKSVFHWPPEVKLAWLPNVTRVCLRLSAFENAEKNAQQKMLEVESKIREVLGEYIFAETEGFDEITLEEAVGRILKEKKITIATAESCTGGLLSAKLTDIAGSSSYVLGGVVAYDNKIKTLELDVPEMVLAAHGAVSEEVATLMARNIREIFSADIGVGITGVAGPTGGTKEKPVGSVWIAISDGLTAKDRTIAKLYTFEKDRIRNRERAVQVALDLVRKRCL